MMATQNTDQPSQIWPILLEKLSQSSQQPCELCTIELIQLCGRVNDSAILSYAQVHITNN